jgi:phosphoglycolate phosphatase
MPRLVIFDCDGTLVDSQHMICSAMQSAFDAHGLPCPPREKVLSIVGLSLNEAFAVLGDGLPAASLVARYKDAFFALRQRSDYLEPLYPGAAETVRALAARDDVVLGIATGKSQRGVRAVLGAHGLLDHFHVIKTSDDAPSKPDPGMVLQAISESGVDAADAVMIGDSIYDMAMARAAGAAAIGVAWGYHTPQALREAGARQVISGFSELMPLIGIAPSLPPAAE